MRSSLAILLVLIAGLLPSPAAEKPQFFSLFWRDAKGRIVYETVHRATKPTLGAYVRGYRHGPFVYPCLGPEYVQHGPIWARTYLRTPGSCFVPEGLKVCLRPATVNHAGIPVIPYLYLGHPPFGGGPECLLPWLVDAGYAPLLRPPAQEVWMGGP